VEILIKVMHYFVCRNVSPFTAASYLQTGKRKSDVAYSPGIVSIV